MRVYVSQITFVDKFFFENKITIYLLVMLKTLLILSLFGLSLAKDEDICGLPMDRGPCKAMKEKVFFNSATGNCEKFFYGGCRGNENNFDTFQECEQKCLVNNNKSNKEKEDNFIDKERDSLKSLPSVLIFIQF